MNTRVPAQFSKEVPDDKNNCNQTTDDHARDVIKMKPRFALFIILIFIIAACTAQGTPPVESIQSQETEQVEQGVLSPEVDHTPTEQVEEESLPTGTLDLNEDFAFPPPPPETSGPDCYGTGPNEIGLGIAEKYEETAYEQVMTWFCNGAEFEDILVALQTEQLTDVPTEEMLTMLADDWTWDEIWQVIGLTEE